MIVVIFKGVQQKVNLLATSWLAFFKYSLVIIVGLLLLGWLVLIGDLTNFFVFKSYQVIGCWFYGYVSCAIIDFIFKRFF